MARNRLVDRAKAAASRSATESPTESHQRRYQADLAHEIGPTTFGRPMREDEEASLLSVMTQPAMLLILAIITFAMTFIVLMWREGRLDGLFPEPQAVIVKDPKAWMLGRNADGVIEDPTVPDDTGAVAEEVAEEEAPDAAHSKPASIPSDDNATHGNVDDGGTAKAE